MARWTEIDATWRNGYPAIPGVYAIYLNGRVVYVGSSVNLRTRLYTYNLRMSHTVGVFFTPWGQGRDLRLKIRPTRRAGDWLMYEYRMIQRLRPVLNARSLGKGRKLQFDPWGNFEKQLEEALDVAA